MRLRTSATPITPNRLCFPIVEGEVAQPLRARCTAMSRTIVILFSKVEGYISSTPSYVTNSRGYASCIAYTTYVQITRHHRRK